MDNVHRPVDQPDRRVGHLNYILVILSVSMSSMRWLRVFGIASGVVGVFYYGFLVSDNISATWECIFAAVNAVQLALVLLAGRRRSHERGRADVHHHGDADARHQPAPAHAEARALADQEPDEVLVAEGQEKPIWSSSPGVRRASRKPGRSWASAVLATSSAR